MKRKYTFSIIMFILFEMIAITLWLTKDNLFYMLNFSYIGTCLALGTALFTAGKNYARHFVTIGSRQLYVVVFRYYLSRKYAD